MQYDLFSDAPAQVPKAVSRPDQTSPDEMLADEIIAALPRANLSTAEALGEEVIARGLGDRAVSGLEQLWRRFAGIAGPLPEHRAALVTLGQLGTPEAKSVLARILRTPPPDTVLPLLLSAAGEARVAPLPARLGAWLEHSAPEVRAAAFALARLGGATQQQLLTGLSDPYPMVRRAALISMGLLGYAAAKPGLLTELGRNPTGEIVQALAGLMDDDDVITHLGRCAHAQPALRDLILEELRDSESPRAARVIRSLI